MKLLIVSHVVHYQSPDGGYHAYAPYAREIEMWAELFDQIVIAAPCRSDAAPGDTSKISCPNVTVAPQMEVGGTRLWDKLGIIVRLPALAAGLSLAMMKADAIHVRCPGNLGLLGALLAPLFSSRLVAKYAGQWNGFPGEEWTVRLQRRILRSRWWRGPVTVYGKSGDGSPNVVSFFSSMFTARQLERARLSARRKTATPQANAQANEGTVPTRIAFVGRLTTSKNVDSLIRAAAMLQGEGRDLRVTIVGDGPESENLHQLTEQLGVADIIEFAGGVSPDQVPDYLEQADMFVLASNTEGWPKAIAEAMAFGLVCVGSNIGLIPSFLGDGRGLLVPPAAAAAVADAFRAVMNDPASYVAMRQAAAEWAQGYSIERLRDALRDLLQERWAISPWPPAAATLDPGGPTS